MLDPTLRRYFGREASRALGPDPKHNASRANLLSRLLDEETTAQERRDTQLVFAVDVFSDVRDRDRRAAWVRLELPGGPHAAGDRAQRRDENAGRLETLLWARALLFDRAANSGGATEDLHIFERWIRDEWRIPVQPLSGTSHVEQRVFARRHTGVTR